KWKKQIARHPRPKTENKEAYPRTHKPRHSDRKQGIRSKRLGPDGRAARNNESQENEEAAVGEGPPLLITNQPALSQEHADAHRQNQKDWRISVVLQRQRHRLRQGTPGREQRNCHKNEKKR